MLIIQTLDRPLADESAVDNPFSRTICKGYAYFVLHVGLEVIQRFLVKTQILMPRKPF